MSYGEWFADWNAGFQKQRAEAMGQARTWVGCRVRVCHRLSGSYPLGARLLPEYGVLERLDEQEGVVYVHLGSLPDGQPAYQRLGVGCVGNVVTLAEEPGVAEG